jgi:inner membrane transporter RhtA
LILPLTSLQSGIDVVGVLYAAAAGAAWAVYIVLSKKAGAAAPAGIVTSLGMSVAFLAVLPFGLHAFPVLFSGPTFLGYALAVGLLSSAVPYSLEMVALRQLPERYFSLLLSLEPAIGAVIALLYLGERLTPVQLIAIGLVVAASLGSSLSHHRASIEPAPMPKE